MAIKTYVAFYANGFNEDVFASDVQKAEDAAESRAALYGYGEVRAVLGPRAIGRAAPREETARVYL